MNVKISVLQQIVSDAGTILLSHWEKREIVAAKSHRDILAEADIASNTFITTQLNAQYPGVAILSEESSPSEELSASGEYRFVLDPLDGTINYSRGIGEFGISLALQKDGESVLGIIYKPVSKTWLIGEKGKLSLLNDVPIRVSTTPSLAEATVAIDFSRQKERVPHYLPNLHRAVRSVRSYGCAVHALGLLATGHIDAYLYETPKLWDIAAFACIITEAGGVLLTQEGKPWRDGEPLLITTPSIAKEIISVIS